MSPTIRLDVGWGAGARAMAVAVGVLVLLAVVVAVALVSAILATASGSTAVAVAAAVVVGGALLYLDLLIVLGVLRPGARLEGTLLVVTDRLRSRRCDLAAAEVSLDAIGERHIGGNHAGLVDVPLLLASEPRTNRTATLRLRTRRGLLLPADQLDALAAAIEAGTRPEPAESRAREVAALIRQLQVGAIGHTAGPRTSS